MQKVVAERTHHFTVALEDVYQLHNTSAVVRSCDVFGIQGVHIIQQENRGLDKKIAMGAQKWVDISRHYTAKECVQHLRDQGYCIVATSPRNDAVPLQEFDVSQRSAFFFGAEKEGLSDVVLRHADLSITIPMYGFTESLNVSVAAAIILQHITYRLRESGVKWRLRPDEQLEKRLAWVKRSIRSVDSLLARYGNP